MLMALLTMALVAVTMSGHPSGEAPLTHHRSAAGPHDKAAHLASRTGTPKPSNQLVQHRVQPGDTLFDIATHYHTKVDQILHHNPQLDPQALRIGQVLSVPVNTVKPHKSRQELAKLAAKMVLSHSGEPNRYIKMIPCQLTAYTNSYESTGKYPGDPGYGITASGQVAKEGWTIAVDPELIPLHSIVYIPGIGVRYAEDTGGAVKGPHIDVYMTDDRIARQFGVKNGVSVYILEEGMREP